MPRAAWLLPFMGQYMCMCMLQGYGKPVVKCVVFIEQHTSDSALFYKKNIIIYYQAYMRSHDPVLDLCQWRDFKLFLPLGSVLKVLFHKPMTTTIQVASDKTSKGESSD